MFPPPLIPLYTFVTSTVSRLCHPLPLFLHSSTFEPYSFLLTTHPIALLVPCFVPLLNKTSIDEIRNVMYG